MSAERILVTRRKGLPRATRIERIVDFGMEDDDESGRLEIVAYVDVGRRVLERRVVERTLDGIHLRALWDALMYWMSGRGSYMFDVEAWKLNEAMLASAGRRDFRRSVPKRRARA